MAADKKKHRINLDITARQVRFIDAKGNNRGVMALRNAQQEATTDKLDLVEIVPHASPPVCRVMDYGKFKFAESKKRAAGRKKQKRVQLKEIKLRPGTDIGDYNVKLRKLIVFLEAGHKIKVTIRFRGREMAHRELGFEMLKRIEIDLEENGTVEQRPKQEGRQMSMVLGPKRENK